MPAPYPEPDLNNTGGLLDLVQYVNSDPVSGGILFVVIMSVIWIIMFVSTAQFSYSRAWTFASFMSSILSIMLAVLDLIDPKFMYIFVFMTAVGGLWLKLETRR